ncbi:hypothetical protein PSACC_01494 [Paramicrosporidium saccamoebae]|uniref:Nucleolar protein 14 n=1 Tax=Paramicrosporidium saccamoebae TaxID=1246581 RepID=A0A2H9TM14_9FUNG|nr:hypothetical protein PSACC_01494 [Paramicrosporidium saccamoebae]
MGKKAAPSSLAFKAGAAKRLQAKPNMFDLKVNKTKFQVLNKNVVGSKGNPTRSKAKSLQVRQKTLLPELGRRGRTGEFVDRRFGEKTPGLSSEEKMLERFSRERLKTNKKKSVFNLNDEDYSHTMTLTHRGRNINDLDAFDSEPEGSDYDSDGGLDSHIVGSGHFGGPGIDNEKRTKAEIMQEVISKSKMHKYERQRVKDANTVLCDDLDADFHSLLDVLEPRDSFRERTLPKDDDYTEAVRTMAFEKRSRPSDRTKTEEEISQAKKDRHTKESESLRKRMHGDLNVTDSEDEEEHAGSDADKSIRRVMDQAGQLLDTIIQDTNLALVTEAYIKLVDLCKTNSVIPVARVFRERLSLITESMNAQIENFAAPKMPSKDSLILFHVIGRIFSTSDYHHIVVTPAQLLMSAYLGHGRMTRPFHLLSALFIMQTMLNYQKVSKRLVPELFGLLGPLLTLCFGLKRSGWSQYSEDRYMSRSVHDLLGQELTSVPSARAISFEDLNNAEDGQLSKEMVTSFLLHILTEAVEIYKDNVAAPELFIPLLQTLKCCPTTAAVAQPLLEVIKSKQEARKPLQLQKSKPIAIPQLIPDLDDGPSREEREQNMLKRQYKRELKGAKKELKKDSAFLAQQKLQMRLEADRKYQDRQRQILGSISNETSHDAKRRRK